MTDRNRIKSAAVISCTIIALWCLLSIAAYVFQDEIYKLFTVAAEETGRVIHWSVIAQGILSIPVILSCVMITQEKGGALPMIASGISAFLMPIISSAVGTVQNILAARLQGSAVLVKLASLNSINSWLSYLLNAACIVAVATAAIHFYASKNKLYIKREDIEE